MLAAKRQEMIKELLLEKKTVTVSEVSSLLKVSEETVRRDFTELEKRGFLEKKYGGAILARRAKSVISNTMLQRIFKENKQIIATRVRQLIHEGDVIFLDSTTTSLQICEYISEMHITVITNSLDIMSYLSDNSNIYLIGVGGDFYPRNRSFLGKNAIEMMQNYYIDKAFVSPKSLDMEFGMTHTHQTTVSLLQLVMRQSQNVIIVADHSKLNRISLNKLWNFEKVDYFVTDNELETNWKLFLEGHGIPYIDSDEQKNLDEDEIENK